MAVTLFDFRDGLVFLLFLPYMVTFTLGVQLHPIWPCETDQCYWKHDIIPVTTNQIPSFKTNVFCSLKKGTSFQPFYRTLPSNLTSLSLSCAHENSTCLLKRDAFLKYQDLETLSVTRCDVTLMNLNFTLDSDKLSTLVFQDVFLPSFDTFKISNYQSLKSITISHSTLINFPPLTDFSASLEILNITHNSLESPEVVIPDNKNLTLVNLFKVDLSDNNINSISPNFFSIIPNLKYLYIRSNKIVRLSLPPNVTLQQLEEFDASDNTIQSFDFKGFASSKNLTWFRIHGNGENYLPLKDRIALPIVQDFTISNFKLNNSLWDMLDIPSVKRLDVSFNCLDRISLSNGSYLFLQKLHIQHNNISELDKDDFVHLPNLLVLNISYNGLTKLPETLFASNHLFKALCVQGNRITALDTSLFRANPEIFYLDLSYNLLHRLPYNIFSSTTNLFYLYLQGNQLKFLPRLSNLHMLHNLDISHNSLKSLPSLTFQGLNNLQILVANNNLFGVFPKGLLSPCPILLSANFDNNRIIYLGSFESHPSIMYLSFQNNSLTDFKTYSPFSGMKSLAYVYLDQNGFESLPQGMFPPSIEAISLSENSIITLFSTSLINLPRLRILNIELNRKVLYIPQSSVQKYKKEDIKPTIAVSFTNLWCDCDLGYLKAWDERRFEIGLLSERFANIKGLENAVCSSPTFQGYRPFKDVPLSQFQCSYNDVVCYGSQCECCLELEWSDCHCALTCPKECDCFEVGSSLWKIYVSIDCHDKNVSYIPDRIPSKATNVSLDGNSISKIQRFEFSHLYNVEELTLNNSGILSIEEGSFDYMHALKVLKLQNNSLTGITSGLFANVSSLIYLDLSHNLISFIETGSFDGLAHLEILLLHNNRLTSLKSVVFPAVSWITLSMNPWSCDCDVVEDIFFYVTTMGHVIADRNAICCEIESGNFDTGLLLLSNSSLMSTGKQSNPPDAGVPNHSDQNKFSHSNSVSKIEPNMMSENASSELLNQSDVTKPSLNLTSDVLRSLTLDPTCFPVVRFDADLMCRQEETNRTGHIVPLTAHSTGVTPAVMVTLIATATVLVVLAFFLVIVIWRRRELQAVLYSKTGVRIWDKKADLDKQEESPKPFDVFVSYSHQDHEYVCDTLVPSLEKKNYRVCVHYRDFPVGGDICDVIKRAIHLSSRTIMVVSKHFLHSNWCRFEFQTAHRYILKEGSQRLILLLLEDIPSDELDPDFKAHLKSNTYLKVQDLCFWQKLYFALPSISGRKGLDNTVMRGMQILAGEDESVERKMKDKETKEEKEKDAVMDRKEKIDWKKEEEKIMKERLDKEGIVKGGEEGFVTRWGEGIVWRGNDSIYKNDCGIETIGEILEERDKKKKVGEENKWKNLIDAYEAEITNVRVGNDDLYLNNGFVGDVFEMRGKTKQGIESEKDKEESCNEKVDLANIEIECEGFELVEKDREREKMEASDASVDGEKVEMDEYDDDMSDETGEYDKKVMSGLVAKMDEKNGGVQIENEAWGEIVCGKAVEENLDGEREERIRSVDDNEEEWSDGMNKTGRSETWTGLDRESRETGRGSNYHQTREINLGLIDDEYRV